MAYPLERRLLPIYIAYFGFFISLLLFGWEQQQTRYLNHDVGWLLEVATSMMEGKRLYTDLIEVNPPLIIYILTVPVILSEWLDIASIVMFRIVMLLFIGAWGLITCYLSRRYLSSRHIALPFILSTLFLYFNTVIIPGDFGQREQFISILLIPFVINSMFLLRDGKTPLSILWRISIVSMTVIAVAMKPYFLFVPLLLELLLFIHVRSVRMLLRWENVAIASLGLAYALLVAWIHPEYFNFIIPAANTVYFAYKSTSLIHVITADQIILIFILCLVYSLVYRDRDLKIMWTALFLASIAAYLGYILQGTNWFYHAIPFYFFSSLAIFLGVYGTIYRLFVKYKSRIMLEKSKGFRVGQSWLGISVIGIILSLTLYIQITKIIECSTCLRLPKNNSSIISTDGFMRDKKMSLYTFSTSLRPAFSFVNHSGMEWTSRFPCLWFIPGLVRRDEIDPLASSENDMFQKLEVYLRNSVLEDFNKNKPELVLVDVSKYKQGLVDRFGSIYSFDYLHYFKEDPNFRKMWEDNYEWSRTIEYGKSKTFDVYLRR